MSGIPKSESTADIKPKFFTRLRTSSNSLIGSFITAVRPQDIDDGKNQVPHLDERALDVSDLYIEALALCDGQTVVVYNDFDIPPPYPPIEAGDAPQWKCRKTECQEWFFALLSTELEYMAIDADEMVESLDGFGPNIYMKTAKTRGGLLGNEKDGLGIYGWVLETREREGAVPEKIVRHSLQVAR
ncbi:hypothetical protein LSUB1_G002090 [Lachnellula subtilissima]|uniref:Uncharacterized protein n=1 Tax=Lachnellula subtilissima TaxID=602034 RepID=A0A8H8RYD5_9HELO|nr:hypothetical protein LSUB1_G002090 [Lachnellula subtilissima]